MHPGAIFLAIAIIRAIVKYNEQPKDLPAPAATPKPKKPRSKTGKPTRRMWLWWVLAARASIPIVQAVHHGWLPGWIVLAAIVLLSSPWWVARHVLIPLGLARPASWATRLSLYFWSRDRAGGAATAAAWALLHQSKPNPKMEAQIEQWIADQKPVLAGGILARALLAIGRGDLASGRLLIESTQSLDDLAAMKISRQLATEWLVADAAERGEWSRVVALTEIDRRNSRLTRFMRVVALRLQKPGDTQRLPIIGRWLLAPRRFQTYELMRRAIAEPEATPNTGTAEAPLHEPLARALALHVGALKAEGKLGAHGLCAVGLGWDVALADQSTATNLLQRATDLQVINPGNPAERLRTSAADDLAALVRQSGVEWTNLDSSDLLKTAGSEARETLLSGIELEADRLNRRVDEERALPVLDEWQEFTHLQAAYRKVRKAGGTDLGRTVFDGVDTAVCNLAVWLYNKRGQKPLGHAMMRWLLIEAEAVGDVEAIRLQSKNVALGCGIS